MMSVIVSALAILVRHLQRLTAHVEQCRCHNPFKGRWPFNVESSSTALYIRSKSTNIVRRSDSDFLTRIQDRLWQVFSKTPPLMFRIQRDQRMVD
jgi:hypothetical protein